MADNIKDLLHKARKAQKLIEWWSQDQVEDMVAAAGWEVYREENARACAKMAVEETEMGVFENKLLKHRKKTLGSLRDLQGVKTVGFVEVDEKRGIMKAAKPVGVIGVLAPVTNCTSTPAMNALSILKTRNAAIFAPHPRSRKASGLAIEFMRKGLDKVGAPADLLQCLKEPSHKIAQELMKGVDLVLATGGSKMVKSAYSNGTPAYGVGQGNATVVVDETADIADAANKVFLGKTFDSGSSCSAENSVIIQESIWAEMIKALTSHGGYLCNSEEKAKLRAVMWPNDSHLNPMVVAKSALAIAAMAGMAVPENITFFMVLGEKIGPDDPFSGEKISPVLTLWKFGPFSEAIEYVENITKFCGYGHSCGIHSFDEDRINELGLKAHVSRMMVRQPQSYGNSGDYVNGMPFSLSLGCGTWGGGVTSENITWKHFLNYTWVSRPIHPVIPDEEQIFGAHWEKHGR
jgi:sulfoacetaldehyde dehydrogenase